MAMQGGARNSSVVLCWRGPRAPLTAEVKVLIGMQPLIMHRVHYGGVIRLMIAAVLLISAPKIFGAEILLVKPDAALTLQDNYHIRDTPHLSIRGEIVAADVKTVRDLMPHLRKMIKSRDFTPFVFLNSSGGDLVAAMQIGATIREAPARTAVDSGAECMSACIFILAAGVDRWALDGSRLGLHRPHFDPRFFAKLDASSAASRYDEMSRRSREYLRAMGIEDQLFSDMLRIPSNRIRIVDGAYAERVRLIGSDPGFEEWQRARIRERHGDQSLRQMDLHLECLNSGINPSICSTRFPFPSK